MSEKIAWNVVVNVPTGPRSQDARQVQVDAYDKTTVTVAADGTPVPVPIQPLHAADGVTFLYVLSSAYSSDITCNVGNDGASNMALDEPHLVAGGAMALLRAAPQTLEFTSNLGTDKSAEVTIFVGRKAA